MTTLDFCLTNSQTLKYKLNPKTQMNLDLMLLSESVFPKLLTSINYCAIPATIFRRQVINAPNSLAKFRSCDRGRDFSELDSYSKRFKRVSRPAKMLTRIKKLTTPKKCNIHNKQRLIIDSKFTRKKVV